MWAGSPGHLRIINIHHPLFARPTTCLSWTSRRPGRVVRRVRPTVCVCVRRRRGCGWWLDGPVDALVVSPRHGQAAAAPRVRRARSWQRCTPVRRGTRRNRPRCGATPAHQSRTTD